MPRVVKDEEKWKFSKSDDGNENWYNHLGEQLAVSSKIVDLHVPYDPAILLPGICSRKSLAHDCKNRCTTLVIAVYYEMVQNRKLCKFISVGG